VLNQKHTKYIDSFLSLNPQYEYVFWDDTAVMEFFRIYYPSYEEFIRNLPIMIYKIDLFRYFVVYEFGGVYSDIDTECLKPINNWLRYIYPNVTGVIGIESDASFAKKLTNRRLQILQWTFAFSPKNDFLWHNIQCIIKRLKSMSPDQLKEGDAAELTGPGTWTDCTKEYFEKAGYVKSYEEDVKNTTLPRLFGGETMVLPMVGFNSDTFDDKYPGYGKGTDDLAFIKHHYHSSWVDKRKMAENKRREMAERIAREKRERESRRDN